ncbi:MAG: nucleotidyltransferase family protein [Planctomycetaceae bacterium]|nr:nucleotidyltransferase family protein [Planctomycetaceae bacterium]
MPMEAVILAGGKGTRLAPYTTVIPKPLVPVGDMAVMEIVVNQLARAGCTRVTVAVSHLAQLIQAYFGDGSKWGLAIDYSVEDQPLSTIGPLRLIDNLPENFLVMNGDVLTDLDLAGFFAAHVSSKAQATIATYRRDVKVDFGVLESARDGRLTRFAEKPIEHFHVSMGVYAFSRAILELVPSGKPYGFDQLMLDMIAAGRDVRCRRHDGYWLDIGRPDDYQAACEQFEKMRGALLGPPKSAKG